MLFYNLTLVTSDTSKWLHRGVCGNQRMCTQVQLTYLFPRSLERKLIRSTFLLVFLGGVEMLEEAFCVIARCEIEDAKI